MTASVDPFADTRIGELNLGSAAVAVDDKPISNSR